MRRMERGDGREETGERKEEIRGWSWDLGVRN